MNAKRKIVCERVASADAKFMTLSGAPSPYLEFRDSMTIGTAIVYELIFVPPSLLSTVIETGAAVFARGNRLLRLSVTRSINGRRAVRIHSAAHGVYFVRVVSD
jgi:hypothetical protein